MITFYVKGDLSNAKKFLENLKLFILAESLGAGQTGPSDLLEPRCDLIHPSGTCSIVPGRRYAPHPLSSPYASTRNSPTPLCFLRLSLCAQWRAWRSRRRS